MRGRAPSYFSPCGRGTQGRTGVCLAELDAQDVALVPELADQLPQELWEVVAPAQLAVGLAPLPRVVLLPELEGPAGVACGRSSDSGPPAEPGGFFV